MLQLSAHAKQRSAQRGVSIDLIDIIHRYAHSHKSSEGSRILSLDASAKKEIREELGRNLFAKVEKKRLYAFWGWNSLNITQFNPHILNHKLVGIF